MRLNGSKRGGDGRAAQARSVRPDARWHRRFFRGVALEFWDRWVTPEQTRREADFVESALRCRPGARVLDVPCGTGRHAVELAGRGYAIVGVDASAEALGIARGRAGAAPVRWLRREMTRLGRMGRLDGAYCLGNSFGYLPPADMPAFVRGVGRALRPGAAFAVQTGMAAESVLPSLEPGESVQIGDLVMRLRHRYLAEVSCLETRFTWTRGRRRESRTGFHWIYTAGEIRRMLEAAGLRVEALLGGLDGTPFRVGDGVLYAVARRS